MEQYSLKGMNALVCGASKGIGKAAAIALSKMGASITILARSTENLQKSLADLHRGEYQDHDMLVADFADTADLKKKMMALSMTKNFQIIVNNTGGPAGGLLIHSDPEDLLETFKRHVICSQIILQQLVEGMKASTYGRIINIISTSVKEPIDGLGVSNTIRGAMGNWSKTLANELGQYNITVNNILPGFTLTERLESIISEKAKKTGKTEEQIKEEMIGSVPLKRFAEADEIAAAIAFLASPAASYINGINLPVDGGRTKSL
jgi:3-oxoacyl-[acyl-carrier protein] reductase